MFDRSHYQTAIETEYNNTAPGRTAVLHSKKACINKNQVDETSSSHIRDLNLGRRKNQKNGEIIVDPPAPLYTNVICYAATRITNVESDIPFRIFVSNSNDQPVDLLPQEVASNASTHALNLL